MDGERIMNFQIALKKCQTVYAVVVRCEGEEDVASLWETKRAAEMCRDEHNNIPANRGGYYGKASVRPMQVKTEAMADDIFAKG